TPLPAMCTVCAQQRVPPALRGRSEGVVVSTKVGRLIVPGGAAEPSVFKDAPCSSTVFDLSAKEIERSLEESLARRGLDRVDIVYIHDPDVHVEAALSEAYPALARLRASGMI